MAMKFAINTNGKEKFYMSTDSNLRKGFMEAVDTTTGKARVVVSEADFEEKVNSYVDTFVKHGVRSFIFAFEEKAKVYYYRMTPGEVKKHKKSLYSFNTDGKFLSICCRVTRVEKATLKQYGTLIKVVEAEDFHEVEEASNGYKAEVILYKKPQKKVTYSDGKSLSPSGKKENSQLKASCRNSSYTLSKSHNIWTAR